MPTITPEMAGATLIVMVVAYILTFAYSVYMAILNHKQAKVKDLMIDNNRILESIDKKLEDVIYAKTKK